MAYTIVNYRDVCMAYAIVNDCDVCMAYAIMNDRDVCMACALNCIKIRNSLFMITNYYIKLHGLTLLGQCTNMHVIIM